MFAVNASPIDPRIHTLIRMERDPALYYVYTRVLELLDGQPAVIEHNKLAVSCAMSAHTLGKKLDLLVQNGLLYREEIETNRNRRVYRYGVKNLHPTCKILTPSLKVRKEKDLREGKKTLAFPSPQIKSDETPPNSTPADGEGTGGVSEPAGVDPDPAAVKAMTDIGMSPASMVNHLARTYPADRILDVVHHVTYQAQLGKCHSRDGLAYTLLTSGEYVPPRPSPSTSDGEGRGGVEGVTDFGTVDTDPIATYWNTTRTHMREFDTIRAALNLNEASPETVKAWQMTQTQLKLRMDASTYALAINDLTLIGESDDGTPALLPGDDYAAELITGRLYRTLRRVFSDAICHETELHIIQELTV